ncbi:endo-1-3(4)-beta-glucanase [Penicillium chermesinum]|nr:endo-1-3(4)-beta-glucanase [Penicillium chermesinum]
MPPFNSNNYAPATYNVPQAPPNPPKYSEVIGVEEEVYRPWYDPRGWSLRKKLIVAGCIVVVIIVVIVGGYEGWKVNRYPNYSKIDYKLVDTYAGSGFFDNFQYFSAADPTGGFVHGAGSNLTYASDTSAIIKVDTNPGNQTTGRNSVRITSNKQYNDGLFIFDIVHTPYGCGTWPALWLTDPSNWPENGEIDVLESNNKGTHGNSMTLHTSKGCKMDVKRKETGSVHYTDCLNTANDNAGCGVAGKPATYGEEFNNNGGGVYAMELREAGIRVWMWARSDIPSDVSGSSSPDPSSWGEALADFPSTECDIRSHFKNQSIVANIDICGEMAGAPSYYTTQNECPGLCTQFAAENGGNFTDAYWEFNSFKVYQAA